MAAHSFFGGAWSYVFKRRILAGLQFHPGIYHEDEDFTPRLLANAKTTITTGITTYAYYQRPHSIINTSNPATIAKRFADLRYILKRLKNSGKTAKDALTQTALLRRYEQLAPQRDLLRAEKCSELRFHLRGAERAARAWLLSASSQALLLEIQFVPPADKQTLETANYEIFTETTMKKYCF